MRLRLRHHIAALTVLCLIPVVAGASVALVRLATGYLWDEAEADVVRLADHAQRAARHAMLANERRHVATVLESFAREEGVRFLRLYDAAGILRVPTSGGGGRLDLSSAHCTSCHADPRRVALPAGTCAHWSQDTLLLHYPIRNEPACAAPSCHPPPSRERLLGVLEVGMDGTRILGRIRELRVQAALWGVVVLVGGALPLLFGLGWAVERPMAESLRLVREISQDNLAVRSRLRRSDEWGELLDAFDFMAAALEDARGDLETLNRDLEAKVARRTHELSVALESARESDRMKTEFLANLSHEFSTPLQGVIGYAQLLLDGIDGELTAAQRGDVEAVLRNGKRLLDWAEDLLELARLDAKRRYLCVDRINMADLVEEVAEMAAGAGRQPLENLSHRVAPGCPEVLGDVAAVRRALFHVLDNAVRHARGSRVTVEAGPAETGWVRVAVRDQGPGMEPSVLDAALRGFSSKGGGGGLAVGLSMARRLVEIHGGSFEVESAPGEGTTVTMHLPAAPRGEEVA